MDEGDDFEVVYDGEGAPGAEDGAPHLGGAAGDEEEDDGEMAPEEEGDDDEENEEDAAPPPGPDMSLRVSAARRVGAAPARLSPTPTAVISRTHLHLRIRRRAPPHRPRLPPARRRTVATPRPCTRWRSLPTAAPH